MIAINATARTATMAMRGQVHALRWGGVSSSAVGGMIAAAPAGIIRVACVPIGVVKLAKASAPAIPGTAAAAPWMSPRRSACAARARWAAELGRSSGRFAMQA